MHQPLKPAQMKWNKPSMHKVCIHMPAQAWAPCLYEPPHHRMAVLHRLCAHGRGSVPLWAMADLT